jgi:hypothetical protein
MQKYLNPVAYLAFSNAFLLSFGNTQYTLDLTQCEDTGGGSGSGGDKPNFIVNSGTSVQFEQCIDPNQLAPEGSLLLTFTCSETGDTVYNFNLIGHSTGTDLSNCDIGKSDLVLQLSVDPSLPQTCTVHNVFSFIDNEAVCN